MAIWDFGGCPCGLSRECDCKVNDMIKDNYCTKCGAAPGESCSLGGGICYKYITKTFNVSSGTATTIVDNLELQLAKTIVEKYGYKLIKNEDLTELKLALDANLKRLNTIS